MQQIRSSAKTRNGQNMHKMNAFSKNDSPYGKVHCGTLSANERPKSASQTDWITKVFLVNVTKVHFDKSLPSPYLRARRTNRGSPSFRHWRAVHKGGRDMGDPRIRTTSCSYKGCSHMPGIRYVQVNVVAPADESKCLLQEQSSKRRTPVPSAQDSGRGRL